MRLTGQRALEMAGVGLDRDRLHRPLFLLPGGGGDRGRGAGAGARRPARPDGDRRAALRRRAGQQLRHALDRRDDGRSCGPSPAPMAWSTANGWYLTKQSTGDLFDRAARRRRSSGRTRRCCSARSTPCRIRPSPKRRRAPPGSRPTPSSIAARGRSWGSSSGATRPTAGSSPRRPTTPRPWPAWSRASRSAAPASVSPGRRRPDQPLHPGLSPWPAST